MALRGFDKTYYLNAKLAQLQNTPETSDEWAGKSVDFLENKLRSGFGLTAEEHYQQYGYQEGLVPNAFFDPQQYIQAKATSLFNDDTTDYTSIDAAADAFVDVWNGNVYQHYLQYGADEGINPSQAFDASAYLEEKLAALQAAGETQYQTIGDVRAAFDAAGLTPLGHFIEYGREEGLSAPEVAPDPIPVFELSADGIPTDISDGADSVTGGPGDEVIRASQDADGNGTADDPQLEVGDVLDGGGGTDRLVVTDVDPGSRDLPTLSAGTAATNIEILGIRTLDEGVVQSLRIDVANYGDDLTEIRLADGDNVADDVEVTNLNAGLMLQATTDLGTLDIAGYRAGVADPTATLALNGGVTLADIDDTSAATESLVIESNGPGRNTVTDLGSDGRFQGADITITGDTAFAIDLGTSDIDTVDGSQATGALTLNGSDGADTLIGGVGADTFGLGQGDDIVVIGAGDTGMQDGTRDTLVSADTGDAVSLQAGFGSLSADYGLNDGDAVGVQAGVKAADGERDIYRDTANGRLVIETADDGNTTQRAELAISDAAKLSIAYEAASDRLVFGQQPPSFRLDGDKLDVTGNNISGLNLNVDLAQDPVRAGFDANADPQTMPGGLSSRGGSAANEVDLSAFDAAGEKVIVKGNANANTVKLGDGDEVIRFGDLQGNDRLMGGAGDDTLEIANGGAGTNAFAQDAMLAGIEIVSLADGGHYGVDLGGQSESFVVNGGDGDNTFMGVGEEDGIDGGAGRDTLRLRSGDHHENVFGDDRDLENVEVVTLGDGGDYGVDLRGQNENFMVNGGDGANTIVLGGGNDVAHGHGGDDTFKHVGHDDKLDGGHGNDTLRIEEGDETDNSFDDDTQLRDIEAVRLADTPTGSGYLGVDLNGQTEGFMIYGNDGENSLQGGNGADWFYGGKGTDTLSGEGGDDVFVVDDFTATDLITDFSVGDDISFGDVVTGVAETPSPGASATLQDYKDAAANTTAGQVNHFEFDDATYLVFDADGGTTSTFDAGNDGMVELYGSVDLSGLKAVDAGNAEAITLAA